MASENASSIPIPELLPTREYLEAQEKVMRIVKRYAPNASLDTMFDVDALSDQHNRHDITLDLEEEILMPRKVYHIITVGEEDSWGTVRGLVEYVTKLLGI